MDDYPDLSDPIDWLAFFWPNVRFYRQQREIIYSVRDNDETYVPAGNMLGKDFVAGAIAIGAFMAPEVFLWAPGTKPVSQEVRIITTSVKDDHLRVLWGEIGRYIQSSVIPLTRDKGGPLIYNHRDIRKIIAGEEDKISYLRGMVSEKGEGLAGHHAASTLLLGDEASGLDDLVYTQAATWTKRMLLIGNPNECNNFFRKGIRAGDLLAE